MSAQGKDAMLRHRREGEEAMWGGQSAGSILMEQHLPVPDCSWCLTTDLQEEFKAREFLKPERTQTTMSAFYVPFPGCKTFPDVGS